VAIKGGGDLVGAGVLPDDGVPVRLAGDRIPDHRRLTLVGDAEACKISGGKTSGSEGLPDDLLRTLPDLEGIVLHPSRPGHDLCVLELVLADFAPGVIEDHAASARRALVDCSDEVGHGLT